MPAWSALDAFTALSSLMADGGPVMWPLAASTVLLWYLLGARFVALRAPLAQWATEDGRLLLARRPRAAAMSREQLVREALWSSERQLTRYRRLTTSLVAIAPLLGLLGTVSGMIATFDALAEGATAASGSGGSGGIAGGISQALLTTQLGLVIAIPGLLCARLLDRIADRQRRALDDARRTLCTLCTPTPTIVGDLHREAP